MTEGKAKSKSASGTPPAATESKPRAAPRDPSTSKRTLLKAGWVAPVILAIGLPESSYADNMSGSKSSRPNPVKPGKPSKPGKPGKPGG